VPPGSFFDAAEGGQLVVARCVACAVYAEPGEVCCPACGSDLQWAPASGAGTVYAYAVVHQVFHPSLAGDVPYTVALVELAEGPRMITRLVGFYTVRPRIGAPVQVTFHHVGTAVSRSCGEAEDGEGAVDVAAGPAGGFGDVGAPGEAEGADGEVAEGGHDSGSGPGADL
jgi:uncharacterized protein